MISTDFIDNQLFLNLNKKLRKIGYSDALFQDLNLSPIRQNFIEHFKISERKLIGNKYVLFELFYLGMPILKKGLENIFENQEIALLIKMGLIKKDGSFFRALVMLYPYRDYYFITDFVYRFNNNGAIENSKNRPDRVFAPKMETEIFFDSLIHNKKNVVLDIGTGCGILAILSSPYNKMIVGIDLNPKAVEYANFNKKLNNISNVEFKVGNLFQNLKKHSFDYIIGNAPHGLGGNDLNILATNGGIDGTRFTKMIVHQAHLYLKLGGIIQIQIVLPKIDKSLILALCGKQNYMILFVKTLSENIIDYASQKQINSLLINMELYVKKTKHMIKLLKKLKLETLHYGLLILKPSKNITIKIESAQTWASSYFIHRFIKKYISIF